MRRKKISGKRVTVTSGSRVRISVTPLSKKQCRTLSGKALHCFFIGNQHSYSALNDLITDSRSFSNLSFLSAG